MVQAANSIEIEMFARRNCASIALLTALEKPTKAPGGGRPYLPPLERPYKCKECPRVFGTYQALGGHRASHMKLTLPLHQFASGAAADRPRKVHECDQCRERFASGQALGGHMRKHARLAAKRKRADDYENSLESSGKCDGTFWGLEESAKKKKRVILQFDLNSPAPVDEPLGPLL